MISAHRTQMRLQAEFGILLYERRLETGLTQTALAQKAGYHRTYISLLERGKKMPTLKTIFDLAKILELPPSKMLKQLESRLANR